MLEGTSTHFDNIVSWGSEHKIHTSERSSNAVLTEEVEGTERSHQELRREGDRSSDADMYFCGKTPYDQECCRPLAEGYLLVAYKK